MRAFNEPAVAGVLFVFGRKVCVSTQPGQPSMGNLVVIVAGILFVFGGQVAAYLGCTVCAELRM